MTAAVGNDVTETDELRELRQTIARFVERTADADARRHVLESGGYVEKLWTGLCELGLVGLLVPEEYGGSGGTLADVAVVIEELGKVPTAVPYLASAVLAASVIAEWGTDEQRDRWLPGLASGAVVGSLATCGASGRPGVADLGIECHREGGLIRLSGTATFVPDGSRADVLVIACRDDDVVLLAIVDATSSGITVAEAPSFDLTRRFADVTCDDVVVEDADVIADHGRATEAFEQLMAVAALAIAADSLGGLERVTELSVQYAKDRVQFGKPIGSFQAIKHTCADMAIAVATTRVAVANVYRSGFAAPIPAAIAKSHAVTRYAKAAGDCIQVHGGIGFTWEHDAHLYLRRAKLNQAIFGDPRWHNDHVASYAMRER